MDTNDNAPYGFPEDPDKLSRLRKFAEGDKRTWSQVRADSKTTAWEKFACCCGCVLIIPVPLAIIGALFL